MTGRKVRYGDTLRQAARLPLRRDPYPEELPGNPGPWRVEPTGITGYYIIDSDDRLVSFTTSKTFAERLVRLEALRPYSVHQAD